MIAWTGESWEVRDLSSANGTWLDGRRLGAGSRAVLARNARLGFGDSEGRWILADDQPAGPIAREPRSGAIVQAVSGMLALPSNHDPRATVFCGPDGAWFVEIDHVSRPLSDPDTIEVDGCSWCIRLPQRERLRPTLTGEAPPRMLADATLWFTPSLDEERVEVRVQSSDGCDTILPPRSCHYVLLVLARLRLQDQQGWVNAGDLAEMLRYSPERLNIEIYRARSVFARLAYGDAAQLIERRPALRQLRIGVTRLHVSRGGRAAE